MEFRAQITVAEESPLHRQKRLTKRASDDTRPHWPVSIAIKDNICKGHADHLRVKMLRQFQAAVQCNRYGEADCFHVRSSPAKANMDEVRGLLLREFGFMHPTTTRMVSTVYRAARPAAPLLLQQARLHFGARSNRRLYPAAGVLLRRCRRRPTYGAVSVTI